MFNLENEDLHVFDVYGRIITTAKQANENFTFEVPISGVYILKINNQSVKILIK